MSRKLADLCVATGKYPKDGKEKTRYENIGVEMENDEGERFFLLKPWVNLSGFPGKGNGVVVSRFAIENKADVADEYR